MATRPAAAAAEMAGSFRSKRSSSFAESGSAPGVIPGGGRSRVTLGDAPGNGNWGAGWAPADTGRGATADVVGMIRIRSYIDASCSTVARGAAM